MSFDGGDKCVHMIGHDCPGEEVVGEGILSQQGGFDDVGMVRIAQDTFTMTAIHPGFDLSATGSVIVRDHPLQARHDLGGQRVSETEGEGLMDSGMVEVRQVAA